MGSSASKVAGKAASGAAGAARRQYPSTSSIVNSASAPSASPATPSAPQVRPSPSRAPPADVKSEHIELDARDPQFGSALRQIGVAKPVSETRPHEDPFPTSSQPMHSGQNIFPSSADNPALLLVRSRQRITEQWDSETENRGRASFPGRTLLSAKEIREALMLRDGSRKSSQEVEKQMRLKPGVLDQLVGRGVVANV